MAFDENLRLPDLLAPIPGESPVGPDLKYSNEYSELELAYGQGTQALPATERPGFPGPGAEEAFGRVAEAAPEFLKSHSKDLRVGLFLVSAVLRIGVGPESDPVAVRSFAGLTWGLELLKGLMEEYWDELHPSVAARAATLSALALDDFTIPVRMVPLTIWGHTHFHFKDWARGADPGPGPDDSDVLWTGSFGDGFEETDRDYYVRLAEELERCSAALSALEEFGRERFGAAEETPPHYGGLKDALKAMTSAVSNLLGKKPEEVEAPPPVPPGIDEPAEAGAAAGGGEAAAGANGSEGEAGVATVGAAAEAGQAPPAPDDASQIHVQPLPPLGVPSEPQDPAQASAAVAAAARMLREEDPRHPVPYLLLRSLRWGEVRGVGDEIDPQLLEAPTTEDRKRLRGLFLEEQWSELLDAAEEVMGSEAGRGWLDLQRYAILAADHLGSEYRAVTNALRGALRSILTDLPSLASATLMDDSAAASADTRQWLEAAGFVRPEDEAEEGEQPRDDTDPEKIHREATYARARQMVQAGDPDGAIQLLMARADRERSERATFVTRAEAAAIMVDRGETAVARPILDELLKEMDEHNLDDWEAGDLVAKPLGLLFRCLEAGEGPLRQQIYDRICRLDPLLARTIQENDRG